MNLAEFFGDEKFDVVLFSDVLEHLVNPSKVLVSVRSILAPGGVVCASIPNIAHGSVRLSLLQGEFRYREKGLLDGTHLRFFTRAGIEELFAGRRVRGRRSGGTSTSACSPTEFDLREQDYPAKLDGRPELPPDALTYQFIVRAEPAADPARVTRRLSATNGSHLPGPPDAGAPVGPGHPGVAVEGAGPPPDRASSSRRTPTPLRPSAHGGPAGRAAARPRPGRPTARTTSCGRRFVEKIDQYAPWGTRRRRLILLPGYAIRIILEKGPMGFLMHVAKPWRWAPGPVPQSDEPQRGPRREALPGVGGPLRAVAGAGEGDGPQVEEVRLPAHGQHRPAGLQPGARVAEGRGRVGHRPDLHQVGAVHRRRRVQPGRPESSAQAVRDGRPPDQGHTTARPTPASPPPPTPAWRWPPASSSGSWTTTTS